MQSSTDLLTALGQGFSQEQQAQILTALRHDPLVWKSVQESRFAAFVLEHLSGQVQQWNPGQLALLALEDTRPTDVLRSEPMLPAGQTLQERALQAFQAAQRLAHPPESLREAGALALALRERRRLTGSWNGLLLELLPHHGNGSQTTFALWRTPLACLYSLIPDPDEMLRSLLTRTAQQVSYDWVVSTQVCQPWTNEEHVLAFERVMHGLAVTQQLKLLRSLSLHGKEEIAASLAARLVIGHPAFANLRTQTVANEMDAAMLATRALGLQQMGTFYHLAGDPEQASSLYEAARELLIRWQAGMTVQRFGMNTAGQPSEGMAALFRDESVALSAAAGWMQDDLGAMLVRHPYTASVMDLTEDAQGSPMMQIRCGQEMYAHDPALARTLAREGAARLLEAIQQGNLPFRTDFVINWQPTDLLKILIDLELLEDGLSLANALLELRPADMHLLHRTSSLHEKLGNLPKAAEMTQALVALEPAQVAWRRRFGMLLGQLGQWSQALDQWQTVLQLEQPASTADQLACGEAALRAEQFDEAAARAEAILQEDDRQGTALSLMGQALVARGDVSAAETYLVRATLFAPEILTPWLTLARMQTERGESQRAFETLRAAVTAIPDASEAHFALGQASASLGLYTEALPHLKKAFSLNTDADEIALLYAQTLRTLGHRPEARAVLERVRPAWNRNPQLAYTYALILVDVNDAESALPILEMALRNGLPIWDAHLLYARILLGEYRTGSDAWEETFAMARFQQAFQALQHILTIDPQNIEARFMLADIFRERGEWQDALATYQALAELPAAQVRDLRWRIQWGLGRTAAHLGDLGTALAALREACQAKPDHLALQRTVAEISFQASLPQEALEAASYALELACDDVDTNVWYANFVANLGDAQRAADAFERAVQLAPERGDLLVALGSSYLRAGKLDAARAALQSVLTLPTATRQDFHRTAQEYMRMQDTSTALICFQRAVAVAVEMDVPQDLLLEMAQVQMHMGDLEAALDTTQHALAQQPSDLPMHLLQSDLLTRLHRHQAALAVLEHADHLVHEIPVKSSEGIAEQTQMWLFEIHERNARLLLESDDVSGALHHTESALALRPGHIGLGYQAASLAFSQMQDERADRILQAFSSENGFAPEDLLGQGVEGQNLLALRIERALEVGQVEIAVQLLSAALAPMCLTHNQGSARAHARREAANDLVFYCRNREEARFLAANARLLARQHNLIEAQTCFAQAADQVSADAPLWLVSAAREVDHWQEALSLAKRAAQDEPGHAQAQCLLARVIVECAEYQRTCEALACCTHAPGAAILNEQHQRMFEDAIHAAGRLVNAAAIHRWEARGQAVFAPSVQTARALAALPAQPDDSAAIIAVLRALNNYTAAFQVARRHMEHAPVLLQMALCALDGLSEDGAFVAEKACEADPTSALAHAAAAMVAVRNQQMNAAQNAYETALVLWPDEPMWHDATADLLHQGGDTQNARIHRQQAVDLRPNDAHFAFKLGQACLATADISGAAAALEKSVALDPSVAEPWLYLAKTYQKTCRLPQALQAAKKAGEILPTSAESLLLAGEIALSMDDPQQALLLAKDAIRREADNVPSLLFLSKTLVLTDHAKEGLDVLESAAPAARAELPLALARACLIHQLHGPAAAVEVFERLVKDYPEDPDLLGHLAQAEEACGETQAAEKNAIKALRLDPRQPDLALMLGRLQHKNGQLDQAVQMLSEAVKMAPEEIEAYIELASVYQERRDLVLALQVYRQAIRVAPMDYRAYYHCGLILRDSKDYTGAEGMLRRAAELAPDNSSIRRQLVGVIALNLVHHKQEVDAA